ncbi:putative SP-containing protein [Vairimorpha necatrix]|uniref:SP-containing protein n=1 Tax=Vairimorpha necatrix TaxID=6039 RepID=A0AAX4J9W3_9MICR
MLFLFLFNICEAGREIFDLIAKSMVKTNKTIYTDTVEYVDDSPAYKDPLNYTSCNATAYFSNAEIFNFNQIDYKDLRVASKYIYRIFGKSTPFKEIIRKMISYRTIRREIFNFKNFHKYVKNYIQNIQQENNEINAYLLLKSLAFKCYKLIYLFSFIELEEQKRNELKNAMVESMVLKTKCDCQWQIIQILDTVVYDFLIESLEAVISNSEKKIGQTSSP